MLSTGRLDLAIMILAGVVNAMAFFAMAKSLQQVPVLYVQMMHATQAAISACAGWLLFSEQFTSGVWAGLMLTALGLIVAGSRERKAALHGESARATRKVALTDATPTSSGDSDLSR